MSALPTPCACPQCIKTSPVSLCEECSCHCPTGDDEVAYMMRWRLHTAREVLEEEGYPELFEVWVSNGWCAVKNIRDELKAMDASFKAKVTEPEVLASKGSHIATIASMILQLTACGEDGGNLLRRNSLASILHDLDPHHAALRDLHLPWIGMTFVFTGSMQDQVHPEHAVLQRGGLVQTAITGHTTFLVVGDEPSVSKLTAASARFVDVLSWVEFVAWLNRTPSAVAHRHP